MSVAVSEEIFKGVFNFRFESLKEFHDNREDPYAGMVATIPQSSLAAVRDFIADLLRQNLDWRELDDRWRCAGSNMLFGSEEQMRAFLREVLVHVERRLASR